MPAFLDVRTLSFASGLVTLACALFMELSRSERRAHPGFRRYIMALSCLFIGQVLVGLQGSIPDAPSVILGNTALLGYFAASYASLTRLLDRGFPRWQLAALAAVVAGPLSYFTFVSPDVNARVVVFSAVSLAYCAAFLWLLLGDVRRALGMNWVLAVSAGGGILFSLLRLLGALLLRPSSPALASAAILELVVAVAVIPMVVGTVMGISTLSFQKTERARRESETLSRSVFEHAPDSIVIATAEGRLQEANPAACALFGYTREQFLGMSSADLGGKPPPEKAVSGGRFPVEGYVEATRRARDGSEIAVELAYARVPFRGAAAVMEIARDVGPRRATERRLRMSEQRYRALVDNVSDIIWEVDREGRSRAVSQNVGGLLGYEPRDLVGRPIWELMPEAEARRTRERLAQYMGSRAPFTGLLSETLTRDGRPVVLESSGVPVFGPDGGLEGFWVCTRDVTERTRADNDVRYHADLLERISEAVISADAELRVLSWNHAAEEIYGWSAAEAMGRTTVDVLRTDYRDTTRERMLDNLRSQGFWQGEVVQYDKSGAGIDIFSTVTALRDAEGRFNGLVAVNRDIRERRKTEEALRVSEESLRSTVMNAPFGIARSTMEGRFLSVNPAFAHILGYASPEELLSATGDKTTAETVYADPAERVRMMQALAGREGWQHFDCIRMRRRDESIAITNVLIRVLKPAPESGAELEAFIEDVTERVRAEAEREKLQLQFQQAQKMEAVGRLAGGIAHDFNNLLTVILGYSDAAMTQHLPGDPVRTYLAGVADAARRAASLTSQLLAFSRKQILQPKLIDLDELISRMEDMLRRLLGEDVELRILRSPGPWRVIADPGQVEQVVMNLAVNARDAMPDGGVLTLETANARLDAAYARDHVEAREGDYVLLSVTDTGHGMDAATLARIFEPFFTTKEKGKGTGLGLATVYGIIRQSGGHVSCYSEPGRGTAFKVFLPRAREDAMKEETEERGRQDPPRGGTERVMLVEDDPMVRELAGLILTEAGYSVTVAASGTEAVRMLDAAEAPPALLVTDVIMPGMDGSRVAQAARERFPGLQVLFVSGYTEDAIVHRGVLDPGVQFLYKPFTNDAFLRKVRALLDAGPTDGERA